MFYQTFDLSDLPRLLTLSFVELSLSADNAIVLGLLTHSLSPRLRQKALLVGSASAFIFRAAAVLGISFLLRFLWIQLVGGLYLIYLCFRHFHLRKKNSSSLNLQNFSFWKTVLLIEAFDLAFAIDSILAGLAMITASQVPDEINPKLWIVYFGGMIGLLGVRYAAHWFSSLIDKFPRLSVSAHLLIGWIGLKLSYEGLSHFLSYKVAYEPLFWTVMVFLFLLGFTGRSKRY